MDHGRGIAGGLHDAVATQSRDDRVFHFLERLVSGGYVLGDFEHEITFLADIHVRDRSDRIVQREIRHFRIDTDGLDVPVARERSGHHRSNPVFLCGFIESVLFGGCGEILGLALQLIDRFLRRLDPQQNMRGMPHFDFFFLRAGGIRRDLLFGFDSEQFDDMPAELGFNRRADLVDFHRPDGAVKRRHHAAAFEPVEIAAVGRRTVLRPDLRQLGEIRSGHGAVIHLFGQRIPAIPIGLRRFHFESRQSDDGLLADGVRFEIFIIERFRVLIGRFRLFARQVVFRNVHVSDFDFLAVFHEGLPNFGRRDANGADDFLLQFEPLQIGKNVLFHRCPERGIVRIDHGRGVFLRIEFTVGLELL